MDEALIENIVQIQKIFASKKLSEKYGCVKKLI